MSAEKVRLHVSPLTPETYPIVVPASLAADISAVSYHAIPTFPERNYGYIELPVTEAERFKKRINGALVKGAKIKVEQARPKVIIDCGDPPAAVGVRKSPRLVLPNPEEVIRGVRIPDGRRVRRGWTQPVMAKKVKKDKAAEGDKKARKAEKSKYTDNEELLFKVKVKDKSGKEAGKKRKRGDDTTIVHEFKQTTKFPTFLKEKEGRKSTGSTEYDPEKGWVDQEGNVVEGPRRSRRNLSDASDKSQTDAKTKSAAADVTKAAERLSLQPEPRKPTLQVSVEQDEATSSSGSSDSGDDDDEDDSEADEAAEAAKVKAVKLEVNSDSDPELDEAEPEPKLTVETTPKPNRTIPAVAIQPSSAASETAGEIHPLEALFKKPKANGKKPPGLELKIPQAFSFFGSNDDDEEDEAGDVATALPTLPQTPFTQADLRFRRERSAAPTPDTAAPTKLLFGPVMDKPLPGSVSKDDEADESDASDNEDDDQEEADGPAAKKGRSEDKDEWFWKNRGDNNRAWKKRRREAAKAKRYEGNKRRTRSSAV